MINARLGGDQANGLLPYVLFNHFTAYQIAVGTLLGLITGGFALIKSRSMFARGNKYFLFAVLGNYPFSWAVEDFTYFLFNPLDALFPGHWSTWFLGGVYAYSPWMPGHPKPEFFIPTWYFLVLAWFLGCNWYAHRCTVYDNLIKDEIGQRILPKVLPQDVRDETKSSNPLPAPVPAPQPTTPKKTPLIKIRDTILQHRDQKPQPYLTLPESPTLPTPGKTVAPAPTSGIPSTPEKKTPGVTAKPSKPVPNTKPRVRSEDAEAALKRLRERWLKTD